MPEAKKKLKLALYWAASCGGCDIAVLDIDEKILTVAELADIVLWPVALDFKYKDVEALADQSVDVCLFNGAVRNSEQRELAELLRQKSKVMVAFGACACFGGIPALANQFDRESIFRRVYDTTPSTDNPGRVRPQTKLSVPQGDLHLPEFYNAVYKLDDVVEVDYYIPGCPPPPELVWEAITAIVEGKLPPKGSTLAGERSLCHTCKRKKEDKKVTAFHRVHEFVPDPEKCLLEQGIICSGPVTREGCGERCLNANMPCRGCFGPTPEALEHGASMLSAAATLVEGKEEAELAEVLDGIVDPLGTFYRFTLADSLLRIRNKSLGLEEKAEEGEEAAS
ncbi:MAG TPA: oxidoreductase [Clostridiales bacterium]|nr:oxidoreductase [Clostridiales bacterium]